MQLKLELRRINEGENETFVTAPRVNVEEKVCARICENLICAVV